MIPLNTQLFNRIDADIQNLTTLTSVEPGYKIQIIPSSVWGEGQIELSPYYGSAFFRTYNRKVNGRLADRTTTLTWIAAFIQKTLWHIDELSIELQRNPQERQRASAKLTAMIHLCPTAAGGLDRLIKTYALEKTADSYLISHLIASQTLLRTSLIEKLELLHRSYTIEPFCMGKQKVVYTISGTDLVLKVSRASNDVLKYEYLAYLISKVLDLRVVPFVALLNAKDLSHPETLTSYIGLKHAIALKFENAMTMVQMFVKNSVHPDSKINIASAHAVLFFNLITGRKEKQRTIAG